MQDDTEELRRAEQQEINSAAANRQDLEARHGQVWNTQELQQDFQVLGFMAPYVGVVRLSDGKRGTLRFQHSPRMYFDFHEE